MTQLDTLPAVEFEQGGGAATSGQFESDKAAFWASREQLLTEYEGQYVAVHLGQVVDHDTDKLKLGLRVYEQFGYRPIYVQLVSRQELPLKRLASPRRQR